MRLNKTNKKKKKKTYLHIHELLFIFSAVPRGMWELTSPTRDCTHAPCVESVAS